ncbi:zf-HC2 domain-containing protein [Aureliella helgolandensis]|uniref:Zinc-finger domain-containing protein n=1 Tax=Aureliella helgolandensis TaxID=2527968 RepID=A0A518G7Z8_9BACT|nr:zf-HC2 domain-containing protein [Aureliella helgolandensis]QDV24702.1 hypothetical protein Q31a_30230 [Aureliella helgolandensis]
MNFPKPEHDSSRENTLAASDGFQEEWLSAYLDDELPAEQCRLVEQKIENDGDVRSTFEDLQRIRKLVLDLPSPVTTDADEIAALATAAPQVAPVEDHAATRIFDTCDAVENSLDSEGGYTNPLTVGNSGGPGAGVPPHPQSRRSGWPRLRLLALAASILVMLGVGRLLWPEAPMQILATNGQPSNGADALAGTAAEPIGIPNRQSEELDRSQWEEDPLKRALESDDFSFQSASATSESESAINDAGAFPPAAEQFSMQARAAATLPTTPPSEALAETSETREMAPARNAGEAMAFEMPQELLGGAPSEPQLALNMATQPSAMPEPSSAAPSAKMRARSLPASPQVPEANSFGIRAEARATHRVSVLRSSSWMPTEVQQQLVAQSKLLGIDPNEMSTAGKDATSQAPQNAITAPIGLLTLSGSTTVEGLMTIAENIDLDLVSVEEFASPVGSGVTEDLGPAGGTSAATPTSIAVFTSRAQADRLAAELGTTFNQSPSLMWLTPSASRNADFQGGGASLGEAEQAAILLIHLQGN